MERLAARGILYAPSHRQDSIYQGPHNIILITTAITRILQGYNVILLVVCLFCFVCLMCYVVVIF